MFGLQYLLEGVIRLSWRQMIRLNQPYSTRLKISTWAFATIQPDSHCLEDDVEHYFVQW